MTAFDFFDRKVCLTTIESEWDIGYREFARVGLVDVQKFQSIPDVGPHESFSRSVRQILSEFYESGANTLLHLEDDCVFKELDHLEQTLSELSPEWDIVYLGANIRDEPERVSEHLYRTRDAWTTHCVGFNRKVVSFLLKNQPPFNEMMFDNWLGSQLPGLNAYVVNPMVAWQRARYSLIWDREVDYDDVFFASQRKMGEVA